MSSKFCYICEDKAPEYEAAWVSPCRCQGFSASVHQQCLLTQVQGYEASHRGRPAKCPNCLIHYRVFPAKGPVVTALEIIDIEWYEWFCSLATKVCAVVTVDVATTTFGLLTLSHIYGVAEAKQFIVAMDPIEAVAVCQFIPYSFVLINSVPWEDAMLHALRRCSTLPVLGRILPKEYPNVTIPKSRRITFCETIVGGLFLPTYARIVGEFIFGSDPSKLKRLILGGALFIVLRGFLIAYYNQKIYWRQGSLTIANYAQQDNDD